MFQVSLPPIDKGKESRDSMPELCPCSTLSSEDGEWEPDDDITYYYNTLVLNPLKYPQDMSFLELPPLSAPDVPPFNLRDPMVMMVCVPPEGEYVLSSEPGKSDNSTTSSPVYVHLPCLGSLGPDEMEYDGTSNEETDEDCDEDEDENLLVRVPPGSPSYDLQIVAKGMSLDVYGCESGGPIEEWGSNSAVTEVYSSDPPNSLRAIIPRKLKMKMLIDVCNPPSYPTHLGDQPPSQPPTPPSPPPSNPSPPAANSDNSDKHVSAKASFLADDNLYAMTNITLCTHPILRLK
ncbi:hypothetical protein JAAARDRAFT_193857 [Jaapia argillacea MUCL 33604]|uniref:Uncharacterized protein n=1 Tax=Jaapia argillacea MUCL 33604 TaxID=933084 RepID=A0A067Q4M4_9AGAM|nr:hypothetical protein JAAARDRAFT_193857 [Jaapia argillacea MUCL 33604]